MLVIIVNQCFYGSVDTMNDAFETNGEPSHGSSFLGLNLHGFRIASSLQRQHATQDFAQNLMRLWSATRLIHFFIGRQSFLAAAGSWSELLNE